MRGTNGARRKIEALFLIIIQATPLDCKFAQGPSCALTNCISSNYIGCHRYCKATGASHFLVILSHQFGPTVTWRMAFFLHQYSTSCCSHQKWDILGICTVFMRLCKLAATPSPAPYSETLHPQKITDTTSDLKASSELTLNSSVTHTNLRHIKHTTSVTPQIATTQWSGHFD